jgi:putative sterol carrier protein
MTISPISHTRHAAQNHAAPHAGAAKRHASAAKRHASAASHSHSVTAFERAAIVNGGGDAGGPEVQDRFKTMVSRFMPDKAKGVDARFHFVISGPKGGEWYVEIKNGTCTVKTGDGPNPTVTLKASDEDYKKIANGDMNKTIAFIRGKLRIDGSKDAIKAFDTYFKPMDGTHPTG